MQIYDLESKRLSQSGFFYTFVCLMLYIIKHNERLDSLSAERQTGRFGISG